MPKCKSCKAPIIWIKTDNFKRMPLDAIPTRGYTNVYSGKPVYMEIHQSHFATCQDADKHRTKKK